MTSEDLRQIEKYLPEGAQIYTYSVGKSNLAAAIVSADIDGDGKDETVVVYNERAPTPQEGTLPLTLSILTRRGKTLDVKASLKFSGGVLFDISIDGAHSHLAVRDVTGDNRPEILVAPGTGASIGGWLEILSLSGAMLRELTRIDGHFFNVQSRGVGKPSRIIVRSNGEKDRRIFVWNGLTFEQVGNIKTQ